MNSKRILFPLLVVCAIVALIPRLFAKLLAASAWGKPVSDSSSFDAIDAYVEKEMRRLNIPGVALAIVEGDRIVHLRGFGHARPGGPPPSPQTPFVLGSTTKSFTALAVMQLVEAGKVELDAPVRRYLPWFCVADAQASTQMTVRHLLNQTSGLPQWPDEYLLAEWNFRPDAAERQARALSTRKLTHPVGSAWEYCNSNYNVLGLIIEAVSGESYPDFIQDHIFAPLRMNHSFAAQAEAKKDGLAIGYRYWFSFPVAVRQTPIPRGSLAGGFLISCAEDMARYLMAHLNGGRLGDVQILSPAGMDELHRGVAETAAMGVKYGHYGMGWWISDIGGTKVLWHGGNVPDFSSYMALLPEQKKGVVLLLNADHYGLPPVLGESGRDLTALVAGQEPVPSKFGWVRYVPWAMRALLLIPLLQIIGVVATLARLRNWGQNPQRRPARGRMWALHILLPLIPNLSLLALPVYFKIKGTLRYLMLFNPDVAWIALICGGFAGIWAPLRTGLILRRLRECIASSPSLRGPEPRD